MIANADRVQAGYAARLQVIAERPAPPARTVRPEPTVSEQWAAYRAQPWSVRAITRTCHVFGRILDWWAHRPLRRLVDVAPKGYTMARSFVLAHTCGLVSRTTVDARRETCARCEYRYAVETVDYCRGDNGGRGCNCGHWPGSRLAHKRRLSAFRCPQQKWGFGRLAQWMTTRKAREV